MAFFKGKTTSTPGRNAKLHGHIPGYPPGSRFKDRIECSTAGVHAPLRSGIHGNAEQGAFSVVLSYGYKDDKDYGETCIYSGQGGRNTRGSRLDEMQGKEKWDGDRDSDQKWVLGNKALKISSATRKPVRLIRGADPSGQAKYAPATGYRYDGLYVVEKAWMEPGEEGGFLTCKFSLRRLPGQPPLPGDEPKTSRNIRADRTSEAGPSKLPVSGARSNDRSTTHPRSLGTTWTTFGISPEAGPAHVSRPISRPQSSPEFPPIATFRVKTSRTSPDPSPFPVVKKPVLPMAKKPNRKYFSNTFEMSTRPPSIHKRHLLPSRPSRSPEIPFSINNRMASGLKGPPHPAQVAPLRMVPVKRPRDVDSGLKDESEEEGDLFGDGSDRDMFGSDLEDGEISDVPVEQKGDRWAAVAGKKKYQDLKFKKMKLEDA